MIYLLFVLIPSSPQQRFWSPSSTCLVDEHAGRFLLQVRHLLSSSDSDAASRRETYGVRAERPEQVRLVRVDSICVAASFAYAQDAGPAGDLKPPFRVAVVKGEYVYAVELATTAGRKAAYWEVVIYDRHWHRLASYGDGA